MTEQKMTERICALNDALRCRGGGGRRMMTRGVLALGEETVAGVLSAVARFDEFGAENDPYGEHDCAVMTVGGVRIIWKIDYYDSTLASGSPDPSDPTVTQRVMTVMLASEY